MNLGQYNQTWTVGNVSTPREWVVTSLTDYAHEYDVPALTEAFIRAVNDMFPDGITVTESGIMFGPCDQNGSFIYDTPDLAAAVDGVDFWDLAQRYCLYTVADADAAPDDLEDA